MRSVFYGLIATAATVIATDALPARGAALAALGLVGAHGILADLLGRPRLVRVDAGSYVDHRSVRGVYVHDGNVVRVYFDGASYADRSYETREAAEAACQSICQAVNQQL